MHPLVKKTKTAIDKHGLVAAGDRVLVAVSAGPDSMALLHVLLELRDTLGISILAAYVDHGLRSAETGQEASLVAEVAAHHHVPFFSGQVGVREYANDKKMSIEHAARELRYGFLESIAEQERAMKIAVAHTADDQAEEVLLRLVRGTGRKGMSGMDFIAGQKVIRPFLGVSKDEIMHYLKAKDISFAVDSSNLERDFLRNRIRLDALPYLAENFNPNIHESLRETAAILQDEEDVLEELGQAAFDQVVSIALGPGHQLPSATLNLADFDQLAVALQRRVLEKTCWFMEQRPSFKQIEQLRDLAVKGQVGGLTHLSQGLRVERMQQELVFSYPQGKGAGRGDLALDEPDFFEAIIEEPGTYLIDELGKIITVALLPYAQDMIENKLPDSEYLNYDALSFPLTIRSFSSGDRFHPLGAPGSKTVSDFFTDQKIERKKRWQVPIVLDSRGIVAVVGLRIDERVRLSRSSKQMLVLSLADFTAF